MLGAPISPRTPATPRSARSGSASRRALGVSSCSAAVRMLSFIGRGRKCAVRWPVRRAPHVAIVSLRNESRKSTKTTAANTAGIGPDGSPVVEGAGGEVVVDDACGREADQHADTVGGQRDETLGGGLVRCCPPWSRCRSGRRRRRSRSRAHAVRCRRAACHASPWHPPRRRAHSAGPGDHAHEQRRLHAEGA